MEVSIKFYKKCSVYFVILIGNMDGIKTCYSIVGKIFNFSWLLDVFCKILPYTLQHMSQEAQVALKYTNIQFLQ